MEKSPPNLPPNRGSESKPPGHRTPAQSPEEGEEVIHYDEGTISRAFRWSFIVGLLLVVAIGAGFLLLRRQPTAPAPQITALSAPVVRERSRVEIPFAKFTDATAAAGIRFIHNNGAYGEKLLPETMGGGCAFLDFDNDGDQDLLFVNGTYWPGHVPVGKQPTTSVLYRNDGKGQFEDITVGSGLDVSFYGTGVAIGDYDNDGSADVFLSAVGKNHLFRNLSNGKFQEVTETAGVGGQPTEWSTSSAWIDYDNDGRLDLFVCNYVRWSREIDFEVGYKLVGIGRAYGQPMNFEGTFPYLYHNEGNGQFKDVSQTAGIQIKNPATGDPMAKSLGVAPADLDGDGWIDLVVANDTVQNFAFINQRNGTFKEIGAVSGLGFDSYGNARGAMGIDTARFRNDTALGIAIGNFANEMNALYVSQATPLTFVDEAIAEGVGPASRLLLKFGVFFFDYDLDGWQDLLTANGHLEEEISKIQQSQQYAQPAQLFWNQGAAQGGGFVPVPPEKVSPDLFKPIVGRGSAFADIDGDGDLDAVLTQVAGAPLLLRNDQQLKHHWVRFKLVGAKSNRDAIGAWIKLQASGQTLSQQVMPTRSYMSQSELPVTIGLGSVATVDSAEVIWASGVTQKVSNVRVDSLNRIEEAR